jgi:hypothetical protein
MSLVLLAIGLVLAVEGLVLALAPRRIEEALQMLLALSVERRRLIGLGSLALGVIFVWLAQA